MSISPFIHMKEQILKMIVFLVQQDHIVLMEKLKLVLLELIQMKDHQLVQLVQQEGNQEYIYKVFYAKFYKHGDIIINYDYETDESFARTNYELFLNLSTTSMHWRQAFTSCTRRMWAPFIRATVFSAVVPFNASSGVTPSRR